LASVVAANWSITGNNAGSLTTAGLTTTFTNVETLQGGAAADSFVFTGDFQLRNIDGGGGSDSINWSGWSTPRLITISALDASLAAGSDTSTVVSLTNGFTDIESITGNGAGARITGPNVDNVWRIG